MRDLTRLNDMAQGKLDALAAEGIEPTPAEVVELNWLGWEVETPASRMLLSRGTPASVGGVTLWPFTIAGGDWFTRVGDTMPESLRIAALGYAMAHGRGESGELALGGLQAERAIKAWYRSLHCTRAEYYEAVNQVLAQGEGDEMPPPQPGREPQEAMSVGELSAFLTATNGGTPETWERMCSQTYCLGLLHIVVAQNAADGKPVAGDPRIEATKALGWCAEKIRRAHVEDLTDG